MERERTRRGKLKKTERQHDSVRKDRQKDNGKEKRIKRRKDMAGGMNRESGWSAERKDAET